MHEIIHGYDPSKVLTWILGIAGSLVATGVIAMVAMLISMGNRLTSIETVMNGNREERQAQVNDLRRRIDRLESDLYERRGRPNEQSHRGGLND